MNMHQLADHIIDIAQKRNKKITNAKLQKILYLTLIKACQQKIISKEWLENQYDSPFYVWAYGPVNVDLYQKFSVYGASHLFQEKQQNAKFDKLSPIIETLLTQPLNSIVAVCRSHEHWVGNKHSIENGTSDVKYTLEHLLSN